MEIDRPTLIANGRLQLPDRSCSINTHRNAIAFKTGLRQIETHTDARSHTKREREVGGEERENVVDAGAARIPFLQTSFNGRQCRSDDQRATRGNWVNSWCDCLFRLLLSLLVPSLIDSRGSSSDPDRLFFSFMSSSALLLIRPLLLSRLH
jgi:hypothetical protein